MTPSALKASFVAGLPDTPETPVALAVSGGSDSMAMMHLAAGLPERVFHVVTVDHGLRPEAAAEAAQVAETAEALGFPHETLEWRGWDGQGNLQDAARRARRRLIADWAKEHAIRDVCLAHTQDDQAETVLMRLARASGVDGLSAMQPEVRDTGITWRRPLLGASRADLKAYLTGAGVTWIDDPSNDDTAFERIRMRKALDQLDSLGISRAELAQTSARLAEAREALEEATEAFLRKSARQDLGDVVYDRAALLAAPREIRRRALNRVLQWMAGGGYHPRGSALDGLLAAIRQGRDHTLHGVRIIVREDDVWFTREARAVAGVTTVPDAEWDGRWQLSGPEADVTIAMLGEAGLSACPNWRDTGRPRPALISSPAVWRGAELVAAPVAGAPNGWSIRFTAPDFVLTATPIPH